MPGLRREKRCPAARNREISANAPLPSTGLAQAQRRICLALVLCLRRAAAQAAQPADRRARAGRAYFFPALGSLTARTSSMRRPSMRVISNSQPCMRRRSP